MLITGLVSKNPKTLVLMLQLHGFRAKVVDEIVYTRLDFNFGYLLIDRVDNSACAYSSSTDFDTAVEECKNRIRAEINGEIL